MKSKTTKNKPASVQHQTLNGRQVVILDEAEYARLKRKADEWEPPLPEPDDEGNYPALSYARASLARKIIRQRRRLGLTPVELARRAGIRLQTLNQIEIGERSPSVKTIDKIDQALAEAEEEQQTRKNGAK